MHHPHLRETTVLGLLLPLLLLFTLGDVRIATAAEPAATTVPAGARQRVSFTENSPLGGLAEYCRRTRQSPAAYKREAAEFEYAPSEESFELLVPATYRADESHGLLVWISPGKADLPPNWFPALERHKLIWICPNLAGNSRHFLTRIWLALDAVHNLKGSYKLDPGRIYIAGFSGGGRVASILALTYPDVFTGAMPMMGCNFYRPLPAGEGKVFRAAAARPVDPLFARARRLPIVLVTGETDGNRPQTQANYEAFKKDRFAHVTYIEVPGIGHAMPDPQWFEKGLADLDAAVTANPATRPATRRRARSTKAAGSLQ